MGGAMENGIDIQAKIDGLLAAQDYELGGFVWVIRPMRRMEWLEILGNVPVLPTAATVKLSKDNLDRQEILYTKLYERFVDGIRNGDEIVKVPMEKLTAGLFQGLGDRIIVISGYGTSPTAQETGRAL
jgi:hypothetical protein